MYWPISIALVLMFSIWLLRKQLGGFIDRAKKISASGIESTPIAQTSSTALKVNETTTMLKLFGNNLIEQQASRIRSDLNERLIVDPQNREEALIRTLAVTQIARNLDGIYHLIYGSQITLLTKLNPFGDEGVTEADVRREYATAAERYPQYYSDIPYENWISFIRSKGLIKESAGHVEITEVGREFLRYLVEAERSPFKPL